MRKLFRFKYEPCNGTCYCYEEIFYEELRGQPHVSSLIDLVVQAHDNLCDNPDYSFGIDKCEFTGIFVGFFRTPTRTETYTAYTLTGCIKQVCKDVIAEDIPVLEGVCNFGKSNTENLAEVIRKAVA